MTAGLPGDQWRDILKKPGNFRVVEIFAIFAVEVFSAKINTTRKFARALPGYHVASARENFHPRNGL